MILKGLQMKRFGFIAAVALFLSATAFGQTAPAPSGVGLIDFQRAVVQNDDGVKAAALYTIEGQKLADGLVKAQAKVTTLQEKLTKEGAKMSDSEKNSLLREIDKEKKIYELNQQDAQNAAEDKQNELFRPVAERVHKVVESYATELNLAVVVDASEDLVFVNDVVDITTEIIRRVNADIVKNPAKPK